MPIPEFAPPTVAPESLVATLRTDGYVVADAHWVAALSGTTLGELSELASDWQDMPVDRHMKDGGRYRRRRHASFVVTPERCEQVPHRAHFQPPEYNALHGGMERWFEPMRSALVERPSWSRLLEGLAGVFSRIKPGLPWYVEAHQFRIDTVDGIGRPTPEGAHRDGVDFVALVLVGRRAIKGGETRVFDAQGPHGRRFTLSEPWSALLLDDERVIHESTPIQSALEATEAELHGHRDTLVLTYRRSGFQDAAKTARTAP